MATRLVCGLVALLALGGLGWGAWRLSVRLNAASLAALLDRHGPALLGVPTAAALAIAVTGIARAFDGKIRLDLLGLRVEDAAGTGTLWIAVFLAVILAIRTLW